MVDVFRCIRYRVDECPISWIVFIFCLFLIIHFSFCIYNAAVKHVETCCFAEYFWKGKLEFALVAILEDFFVDEIHEMKYRMKRSIVSWSLTCFVYFLSS